MFWKTLLKFKKLLDLPLYLSSHWNLESNWNKCLLKQYYNIYQVCSIINMTLNNINLIYIHEWFKTVSLITNINIQNVNTDCVVTDKKIIII